MTENTIAQPNVTEGNERTDIHCAEGAASLVGGTNVATSGTASSMALFKSAPREAKIRPLVGNLVLPTPSSSTTSNSQTTSPSPSLDKTDNPTFGFNAESPDMQREEERIKTFERWPVSFLTPEQLARNGFYYLGRGDEVRCAFCKVEIMRWENGDDPAKDHKKWAPQCPFLRRGRDGRDECGARTPPAVAAAAAAASADAPRMPGPVSPRYASKAARLRSFIDWPRSLPQKPEELADAGFWYTGMGDQTKCFYCDGGLKDWESDDEPWEQHARWFKRCAYVLLVKGEEYIQKVISEAASIPAPVEESSPALTSPAGDSSANEDKRDEEDDLQDSKLCRICYAEERNVCFVPCGHVVACAKCALSTNKCPMCRRTFHNAVRIYFS